MAAQSSTKSPHANAAAASTTTTNATRDVRVSTAAVVTRRKSVVSDPDELLLLREKLHQIAVGLDIRADGDSDSVDDGYDAESERLQRRRRQQQNGCGHFKVFPLLGERPSTPPSSPQPRDVLRKQLRLRNSSFRLDEPPPLVSTADDATETAMLGVSVDAVEVSRFEHSAASATVRLSIPSHLRVQSASSSFSVLTKNPEGLRKRKSDHVADTHEAASEDAAGPLKKVSSDKNILAAAPWDYDAASGRSSNQMTTTTTATCVPHKDEEMEDVSPESPSSALSDSDMEKLCS